MRVHWTSWRHNRLASNSLLEALVFGARVADAIKGALTPGALKKRGTPPAPQAFAVSPAPPHVLRAAMNRYAGLERTAEGLGRTIC